jgi:rubrerythrin
MYPDFIKDAEGESIKRAATSFRWAWEVEKLHEVLYRKTLATLEAQKPMPEVDYYVCPVCGFTHEGPLEGKCPVCGTPTSRYERIS